MWKNPFVLTIALTALVAGIGVVLVLTYPPDPRIVTDDPAVRSSVRILDQEISVQAWAEACADAMPDLQKWFRHGLSEWRRRNRSMLSQSERLLKTKSSNLGQANLYSQYEGLMPDVYDDFRDKIQDRLTEKPLEFAAICMHLPEEVVAGGLDVEALWPEDYSVVIDATNKAGVDKEQD